MTKIKHTDEWLLARDIQILLVEVDWVRIDTFDERTRAQDVMTQIKLNIHQLLVNLASNKFKGDI